jgi:hypothetical protein
MSDSILNSCDPVTDLKGAQKPIITMLLPVKGLRHDNKGEITADAIQTVIDGMKNLGISIDSDDAQTAILAETKQVLCNLNAQYEFLLATMFMSIRNSEVLSKSLLDSITEKNVAMRDVLSVSRQILLKSSNKEGKMVEGFTNNSSTGANLKKTIEAFQSMSDTLETDMGAINTKQYSEIKRNYDVSVEKNKSVSANLALYSFLNIVAVGLLFYIVSVK